MSTSALMRAVLDVEDSLNSTSHLLEALFMAVDGVTHIIPDERDGLKTLAALIQDRIIDASDALAAIRSTEATGPDAPTPDGRHLKAVT